MGPSLEDFGRSQGNLRPSHLHRPPDVTAAFSFTSNLLANSESADRFAALLRALYMALDERQISYLQGTIQLVLQSEAAEQVQQRLEELGITATFKDI